MKKSTAVANVMTEEQLALMRDSYPVEKSFNRIMLPRLGMTSQDVVEGKGKSMKVVTEAGTFFIEKQSDEEDENGKKIWKREEIGTTIQGTILFQRKQLRFFDGESYTSSPIYDNDDQIIPLFSNKQEVDRGTPEQLKKRTIYQGKSAKGKPISKLEENRILYVLFKEEVYQLNVRGTSMFAFMTWAKKNLPPSVLTKFGSEPKENGAISWSQMTFEAVRILTADEADIVQSKMAEIKEAVEAEKSFYATKDSGEQKADEDLKKLGKDDTKDF